MSRPPSTQAFNPAEGAGRMAGEYRIGRKLGEGGFGAVYEAEHPVLGRRAAVKVLHRVAEGDSEAERRFVAEAQAVNQIRTRHIVDIFSFGRLADGRHFYVMDLLDGVPLDELLRDAGKLELPLALQILQPIAEALDKAHAAGIVHRDLKPQNIFLSWDAAGETVPVLLDFGVAKLMGDSPVRTASGTPIGTPLYMAPEQARGAKIDGRADVYALGVLCYELLTGTPPLQGASTVAVLMAHIADQPAAPSASYAALPTAVDAPILHMLEKEPEARPASAGEALAALRAAAEGAGFSIPAGLPRLPKPAPRPLPASESVSPFPPTVAWSATYPAGEGPLLAQPPAAQPLSPSLTPRDAPPVGALRAPLWIVALLALGTIAGYLYFAQAARPALRATPGAEGQGPSAPAQLAPSPAEQAPASETVAEPARSEPSPAAEAGSVEPSVAPTKASSADKAPRERKPQKRRDESIPSDLESPF